MFMDRAVNPGMELGLKFSDRDLGLENDLVVMINGKFELCFVELIIDDDCQQKLEAVIILSFNMI